MKKDWANKVIKRKSQLFVVQGFAQVESVDYEVPSHAGVVRRSR